ncbi:MAG: hypothetical protein ABJG78_12240 [Cyclobacteriaceae bacterium]
MTVIDSINGMENAFEIAKLKQSYSITMDWDLSFIDGIHPNDQEKNLFDKFQFITSSQKITSSKNLQMALEADSPSWNNEFLETNYLQGRASENSLRLMPMGFIMTVISMMIRFGKMSQNLT